MKGMVLKRECTLKSPGELLIFAMPRNQCPVPLNQTHWDWNPGNSTFRAPLMIPGCSQVWRTTHRWYFEEEYFRC